MERLLCELTPKMECEWPKTSFSITVLMDGVKNITFTFVPESILGVAKVGSGVVTSSPGGIYCGSICGYCWESYPNTTVVTLTATPAINATFLGWEGDCSGTGDCVLNMSEHRNVTALFTKGGKYMLTVNKSGSGTIISNPPGINCGSDCSELYEDGTEVTLTATADSGWSVWSFDYSPYFPDEAVSPLPSEADCQMLLVLERLTPGVPTTVHSCSITMDMSKTVTWTFVKTGARTIYVPDNHAKIQWAVDNASAGDTIIVYPGTYTENVKVNKDHLTIRSENGAELTIVQAANSDDHVFEITASSVNISGFTVTDATATGKAGIYLSSGTGHCI
jgi:hypothetical protein